MKLFGILLILLALCSSAAPAAAQVTTLRVGFNGFYGAAPF